MDRRPSDITPCAPITRYCTNDASLPDNCDCGDCGYLACGDCDCDHYGDDHCCTGSFGYEDEDDDDEDEDEDDDDCTGWGAMECLDDGTRDTWWGMRPTTAK